jgi:hypothetical protein
MTCNLVELVSVVTQVDEAVVACRDSLRSLYSPSTPNSPSHHFYLSASQLEGAKQHLAAQRMNEQLRHGHWVDWMATSSISGTDGPSGTKINPQFFNRFKPVDVLGDFYSVLDSITVDDIKLMMSFLQELNPTDQSGDLSLSNQVSQPSGSSGNGVGWKSWANKWVPASNHATRNNKNNIGGSGGPDWLDASANSLVQCVGITVPPADSLQPSQN